MSQYHPKALVAMASAPSSVLSACLRIVSLWHETCWNPIAVERIKNWMAFRGSTLKRFEWLSIIPHFGCAWWTHISHLSLPSKISPKKKALKPKITSSRHALPPIKPLACTKTQPGTSAWARWHPSLTSKLQLLQNINTGVSSQYLPRAVFPLKKKKRCLKRHQKWSFEWLKKNLNFGSPFFATNLHLESLQLSRALHHEVHTRGSEVSAWRGEAIKTRKKVQRFIFPKFR